MFFNLLTSASSSGDPVKNDYSSLIMLGIMAVALIALFVFNRRSNKKKEEALLPVAERSTATKTERAVANVVSYINDKLTIKEPPVKDKTIRAFPFRASASALLSAVVETKSTPLS